MADPGRPPWTSEEFFAWQERQAERYELVDGLPVRLMAGARNVHDDIVVNILAELREKLRGSGCRPFTGGGSVEIRPGLVRRPDVGVDCGPRDPNAMKAADPTLVVEVLSPSTRDFDTFRKLEEYKGLPGLSAILLVEPNAPLVALWSREPEGNWIETRILELDATVDLPAPPIRLALGDIYDGVRFPSAVEPLPGAAERPAG